MPERRPAAPAPAFGAIVLAAGGSSRMGVAKQLLDVNGVPLIARALGAVVGSGAHPVVVVLGADEGPIRASISGFDVIVASNPDWREGLSSSVRVGMAAILGAVPLLGAVLLAPCDQPALSAGILARLAEAHRSTGRIACARFGGRNASPAVFGRVHFPALQSLSGDQGARALLNGDPGWVEPVDLPELGADLDTMADYEDWSKGARGRRGP